MPKSFLDLVDSIENVFDEEGIQVSTLEDAIRIAKKSAMDIMASDLAEGKLDLRPSIVIRDETGATVHVVRFRDLIDVAGCTLN